MQYTTNLNLKKYEITDAGDPIALNENMDTIDSEWKSKADLANGTVPTSQLPTIPVSKGGTNKTSWTSNRLIYPSSSTVLTQMSAPTKAKSILKQDTSGAPYWSPPATTTTYTLSYTNWTGTEAPYTYNLSVSGVTSTSNQDLLPGLSITAAQLEALQAANIQDGGQSSGRLTLKAWGDKPTINIPVRVIVRGDA